MSIEIGQKAPAFTLVDTARKEVNLSDFNGKNVLLLFFPLAFTGVCTTELCSVRDNINMYEKVNAQVLGISVDSPFTLGKFKEEQKYNFPLLSDFNKTVSKTYGAFYETFLGMNGIAKRSAFVIDKTGVVRYAEVLEDAHGLPNFEAINALLATL
ncbi:MAG: peroxiredoxin [Chitinophagales bacterium]|nr:peroxiredoxin [Chitinophagales bacterium]